MKQYYYVDANNQSVGPFSVEDLVKRITPESFVWTEGMANWVKANTVAEVMGAFNAGRQPQQYQQPQYGGQQQYQQPNCQQQPQYGGPPQQQYQQQLNYQQPQYQQYGNPMSNAKPNNYLVWSILSIILCCWPVGVAAVVYAAKVDSLWGQGRYDESRAASEKAKNLTIISAICGVVVYVIYGILIASGALGY